MAQAPRKPAEKRFAQLYGAMSPKEREQMGSRAHILGQRYGVVGTEKNAGQNVPSKADRADYARQSGRAMAERKRTERILGKAYGGRD